jgi:hypothetical protein
VRLVAGVACVEFQAPLGAAMMGYGARTGSAASLHDPLAARALYLACGGEALLVECDVCLLASAQADAVRARIARETGVPGERVLVGSIHTHSGPDTGFGALLAGREPPAYVAGILDAAARAGAAARARAAPARLGVARAAARIGRNRRVADGPLDPEVLVLRVDGADGSPLGVLFVHGCHPTALGHENLAYSADWPWAARERVERLTGATAFFALGAHADVDPRTRGLLDLAIANQSVGVGFEEVERLGREVGDAVAEAAGAAAPLGDVAVAAGSRRSRVPVHGGELDPADYEAWLAASRAEALRALDLPETSEARSRELYRLERERTEGLPAPERRRRIARVRRYLRDRSAPRFAFGRRPAVETQVLRLGPVCLLGLPVEATVAVGLEWKRRLAGTDAALLSIANGWIRYLPHPDDFAEPGAEERYEILQSTLVPEAAPRLLDAGEALARELAA